MTKIYLIVHSDLALWPQKYNQFIIRSRSTFVPKLKKFSQTVSEIWCSQSLKWCEVTPTLTFNLWPPESKQFTLQSKWMFMSNAISQEHLMKMGWTTRTHNAYFMTNKNIWWQVKKMVPQSKRHRIKAPLHFTEECPRCLHLQAVHLVRVSFVNGGPLTAIPCLNCKTKNKII